MVDLPEAIWHAAEGGGRELLYLAHTHVPTRWSRQNIELAPVEWDRSRQGRLQVRRRLPNGVAFGATAESSAEGVAMTLWLENGSKETLSGLSVQNCVMLRGAQGFEDRTNENKRFEPPLAACVDRTGRRWIICGWSHCQRAWGNQHCPCLHSDPKFPDCPPGKRVELRGWLSFYEGDAIEAELARIRQMQLLGEQ